MEIPNNPLKLMIKFVTVLHNCDLYQEIEYQEYQLHKNYFH